MQPRRTQDEYFAILVDCALKGERCPLSHWRGNDGPRPSDIIPHGAVNKLARQGKILIEVSGRNWRTITILVGEHAGKKTASDPNGGVIWQTVGTTRTLNTSAMARSTTRPGPSAPRRIG